MNCSDWINLGVAIGTILLAIIAATTTVLSLVERKKITARRNDEILINEVVDWTNKLDETFKNTDDKQPIRDFLIDFMQFVSPTEDINSISKHFAKRYPKLGTELNNEIEKLKRKPGFINSYEGNSFMLIIYIYVVEFTESINVCVKNWGKHAQNHGVNP